MIRTIVQSLNFRQKSILGPFFSENHIFQEHSNVDCGVHNRPIFIYKVSKEAFGFMLLTRSACTYMYFADQQQEISRLCNLKLMQKLTHHLFNNKKKGKEIKTLEIEDLLYSKVQINESNAFYSTEVIKYLTIYHCNHHYTAVHCAL